MKTLLWVLSVFGVAALALVALWTLAGGPPLDVGLSMDGETMHIRNNACPGWKSAELELNQEWFSKMQAPAVGETAHIPLRSFAKKNGELLDPQRVKFVEIRIFPDDPWRYSMIHLGRK